MLHNVTEGKYTLSNEALKKKKKLKVKNIIDVPFKP